MLCSVLVFGQAPISSKLYAKDLKLANTAFETEDYLNAITLYKKVLAIDPNHEKANLNSIISRLKLNQAPDSSLQYLFKLKKAHRLKYNFTLAEFITKQVILKKLLNATTTIKTLILINEKLMILN